MLGVTAGELAEIHAILRKCLPAGTRVWVFGSRVHGRALRRFSDLDLAVELPGARSLTISEQTTLSMAFEDSDLPWKVDVVDLNAVDAGFRRIVEGEREEMGVEVGP